MRFFENLRNLPDDRGPAETLAASIDLRETEEAGKDVPVSEIPWDIVPPEVMPAPPRRYEIKATLMVSIHDYRSGRTAHEFTVRGEEEVRSDRDVVSVAVARVGHSLLDQANRLAQAAAENLREQA